MPMSNTLPKLLPFEDAELSLLSKLGGSMISNAPKRLNANTMKIVARNKFINGSFAKFLMPAALERSANKRPKIVNVAMMPVANTMESTTLFALGFRIAS